MPNDYDPDFPLRWMRVGVAEQAAESAFDSLGWWLTGGLSLLVWTGLVLLLTNA